MPAFSLPMYDWPEVRSATDAWGAGLARHLRRNGFPDAPEILARPDNHYEVWHSRDLLITQVCGYTIPNEFSGTLQPLVTPHYAVEGCAGPLYCSFVFVRAADGSSKLEDLRGKVSAYNAPDSMSGMLALKLVFAPFARNGQFFTRAIETGEHVKSLQAVSSGAADVCAIDAVCVALARRYRPELLSGLAMIARSPMAPGLPYVTRADRSVEEIARLRQAIGAAFADPALHTARQALSLSGYSILDRAGYGVIANLERDMTLGGGLRLWETA